jgi:hypothetical protein
MELDGWTGIVVVTKDIFVQQKEGGLPQTFKRTKSNGAGRGLLTRRLGLSSGCNFGSTFWGHFTKEKLEARRILKAKTKG